MGELGESYASRDELKAYLKLSSASNDASLTDALASASEEIERYCNRQFNRSDVATPRTFKPVDGLLAQIDDLYDVTGLVVKTDTAGTGTFDTTLTAGDFELSPANGIVDGQVGWPFYRITATGGRQFPTHVGRELTLEVTAKWGWSAVPAPIKRACLLMAAQNYKLADAPFGVAGFDSFGAVRVRNLPQIEEKLRMYRRHAVLVG